MANFKLQPAPGVCIVEPISEETTSIVFNSQPKGKISRGKVLAVGPQGVDEVKYKVPVPCKAGDIIWFLKYENEWDDAFIDGVHYVMPAFKDIRVIEK